MRVTSVDYLETSHGVAFTATVEHEGRVVGSIENGGHGGPTSFRGVDRAAQQAWLDHLRTVPLERLGVDPDAVAVARDPGSLFAEIVAEALIDEFEGVTP